MSILAMDQYGFFLTRKLKNSVPVRTKKEINEALRDHQLPILLPFDFLYKKDPVPHSWEFTSDSISAYLADQFRIPKLILLKVVDGIMVQPGKGKKPVLEKMISKKKIKHIDCVDRYLGKTLKKNVECWVINGRKPKRILELIQRGETIGTRIVS